MNCWIGLGSNQGLRRKHLAAALSALAEFDGGEVLRVSSLYEGPYQGPKSPQSDYLNLAVQYETELDPVGLLALLKSLEAAAGRRSGHQEARELDLDLLVVEGLVRQGDPEIPHPRLSGRRFVLQPLAEMDADLRPRPDGPTVAALLGAPEVASQPLIRVASADWWKERK